MQVDQTRLEATLRVMPAERLTVHELKTAGTTVREYVSPAGMVFGVAWQGTAMPDLRQLLGAYFDQYVATAAARRTRRAPVLIELPGLVVSQAGTCGHLRARRICPRACRRVSLAEDIQ